jgi:hypothetical integral membrane protein (TIGR02206 family)
VRIFEAYTWQHLLPILSFLSIGFILIVSGRRMHESDQRRIGAIAALVILIFMIGGSLIKVSTGTFNVLDDLPLYLCRVIAWMLPFVIWRKSRFWLGIFYFWILAGTLQGILTPDLAEGFPAFLYFRYWFLHAGLVTVMVYTTIVFRLRITWRDFWRAVVGAQIYLLLIHGVNLLLGSNYSYTMHKPPGPSLLDLFGSWPWYILGGELLMILLFLLLMLPWLKWRRQEVE